MKRHLKVIVLGVIVLIGMLTLVTPCSAEVSPIAWQMINHKFYKNKHTYTFQGNFIITNSPNGINAQIRADVNCEYDMLNYNFHEIVYFRITRTKYAGSGTCNMQGYSQNYWLYITDGIYFADPWLNSYPGMSWPGEIRTRENHYLPVSGGCFDIIENYLDSFFFPMSLSATAGLREQLTEEAAAAPWPPCEPGAPGIVSPGENQLFESGHVPLYFEFDCRYDDYSKNFFMIYLQRRVSKAGKNKKIRSLWQPVGISELYLNRLKMRPSVLLYEVRSFGQQKVHLRFDGEYTELRMRVESWIWDKDQNKYMVSPQQPEWRHFRVGHPKIGKMDKDLFSNMKKLDLLISEKVDVFDDIMWGEETHAILFQFRCRNNGGFIDQPVKVDIQCKKNGEPIPQNEILLADTGVYGSPPQMGEEKLVQFWVKNSIKSAQYDFTVTADPAHKIQESNEENNSREFTFHTRGYKPRLKPRIEVTTPLNLEWQAGKEYLVEWKGTLVRPGRKVQVLLHPELAGSGPETNIRLSPPGGLPFDDGHHLVRVPAGTLPGRYRIYLEMVGVPVWQAYSDGLVTVRGGLKPGALGHLKPRIRVHRPSQPGPWYPGENHSVRWQSSGIKGKVRIFLGRGQGEAVMDEAYRYEWSPPGGVPNTGYWRHNLPRNIKPDEQYRICIQSVENSKIMGCSEAFPIRMPLHPGAVTTRMRDHLDHHPAGSNLQLGHKPALKPSKKPPAVMQKLWLKSPRGMETWYIGKTYPVTWKSTGVTGRVRVVLVDRHGKTQTLNGMIGTNVSTGRFSWKIGSNIKPGSMYTIYLITTDGKIKSTPSGGFNIKMKVNPSPAKKTMEKKTKPKLNTPPKGAHIN